VYPTNAFPGWMKVISKLDPVHLCGARLQGIAPQEHRPGRHRFRSRVSGVLYRGGDGRRHRAVPPHAVGRMRRRQCWPLMPVPSAVAGTGRRVTRQPSNHAVDRATGNAGGVRTIRRSCRTFARSVEISYWHQPIRSAGFSGTGDDSPLTAPGEFGRAPGDRSAQPR